MLSAGRGRFRIDWLLSPTPISAKSVTTLAWTLLFGLFAAAFTWLLLTRLDSLALPALTTAFLLLTWHRPLWGLFALLALPIFGEFSRLDFLGRSIVLSDLFIPLFELLLLWRLRNRKKLWDPRFDLLLKMLFLFLIIAFFSLLYSLLALPAVEVLAGSLYLVRLIFYLALIPCSYWLINSENLPALRGWLVFVALALAAGGFLQLQILPDLEELAKSAGYDPHINRLVGSWLDPNFIGGYFAAASLFLVSLALYRPTDRVRILLFITSAALLPALFLTYSRSAWLAFLCGLLVLGLLKARRLLIIVLIIGAIGLSVSDRAQQRAGELVTSMTSVLFNTSENPDPTARLRIQNWEQTLELIGQKPLLGHGYNNLAAVKMSEGFIKSEDVHSASGSDSSLLTLTATTGFAGLLVFLYFLWLILRDSWQTWRRTTHPELAGWSLGLFIITLTLLVHSNFVNSLFFPQILLFYLPLISVFYRLRFGHDQKALSK